MAGPVDFAQAFAGAEGGNAPPDALERMNAEVDKLIKLEAYISETEELVKAAKAAANEIKQKTLPDIMAEVRTDEIVRDGYKIKITDFVSGTFPNQDTKPAEHEKAVAYLKQLPGGADLLKTSVSMDFGRGQENVAAAVIDDLRREYDLEPSVKYGVHAMTLQAFAREKIANAEAIDTDVLGLYCGRAVKVTQLKGKKK